LAYLLESVQSTVLLLDSCLELTIWQLASTLLGRRKVQPEERVIDVAWQVTLMGQRRQCDYLYRLIQRFTLTTSVELDGRLRCNGALDVVLGEGVVEGLLGVVEVSDVGVVVLGVVQLHDLSRDVGLQSL
jgi:hypothetical protein